MIYTQYKPLTIDVNGEGGATKTRISGETIIVIVEAMTQATKNIKTKGLLICHVVCTTTALGTKLIKGAINGVL